jgi:hypothetical protein
MSTNALMEEQADSNEMPLKYGPPTLIRHSAIKSGESVQTNDSNGRCRDFMSSTTLRFPARAKDRLRM